MKKLIEYTAINVDAEGLVSESFRTCPNTQKARKNLWWNAQALYPIYIPGGDFDRPPSTRFILH